MGQLQLTKHPVFKGTIVLNLKIAASGAVENVDVKSSTTDYPEFDADIVKAVSSWMFPKSKAGGNVTIPFTFYVNE
ncbi:TonB family protein [Fibrobacter sp.]|uniref:TonB family protein n=1 Tax=Fibrobacter sp. TaxID=35828 RepID=UPI0025C29878|nr:TonB family protein [Fibrobacter sp.]